MAELLYGRFLELPEEYERAEQVWRQGFSELTEKLGVSGEWEAPWMSTAFVDGSPIRDGNPIFSAKCPEKKLGLRVIQDLPGKAPPLSYWIDVFAEGEPAETRELVICCVLTRHTLQQALTLMRQWILRGEVLTQKSTAALR